MRWQRELAETEAPLRGNYKLAILATNREKGARSRQ
jgi:hypothetical protein